MNWWRWTESWSRICECGGLVRAYLVGHKIVDECSRCRKTEVVGPKA